jgi:menaquinol-cytochrome c reductase iron-sulfur subunit
MADPRNFSRRDFVKITTAVLGTIIGAVIGLPAIDYLLAPALKAQKTDAWVPLGKLAGFALGQPTLVTFTRSKANGWEKTVDSYGVFVVRKSDTDVIVLSNVCTHLSCRVNWKADQKEFICPCHNAQFSAEGNILGGPPPRPLDRYQTKVENGTVSIHLLEG